MIILEERMFYIQKQIVPKMDAQGLAGFFFHPSTSDILALQLSKFPASLTRTARNLGHLVAIDLEGAKLKKFAGIIPGPYRINQSQDLEFLRLILLSSAEWNPPKCNSCWDATCTYFLFIYFPHQFKMTLCDMKNFERSFPVFKNGNKNNKKHKEIQIKENVKNG